MRATTSSAGLSVKVGRFNEPTQLVELSAGSTIQDAINKLGISISDTETLWVDGEKAELHFEVENGDRIIIVGKKEGGVDTEPENNPEVDDEYVDEEENTDDAPTPEVE